QRMNSEFIGKAGGGGVGIGTSSPFGTQFGEYASRLRDLVARNWRTSAIEARIQSAPTATITFILRRDGTVVPDSVRVTESSGNRSVDISAHRAILDSEPFPPLPPQYTGSEALLEFRFTLRR